MEGINEAVIKQLNEQKGGKDVLPLWKRIWSAYQKDGVSGVDAVLTDLTNRASHQEEGT